MLIACVSLSTREITGLSLNGYQKNAAELDVYMQRSVQKIHLVTPQAGQGGPARPQVPLTWMFFGLAQVRTTRYYDSLGEGKPWAAPVPMVLSQALRLPGSAFWELGGVDLLLA